MNSQKEAEESKIDFYSKEQENENYPLKKMDIIDSPNDKKENNNEIKNKNYLKILYIVIFLIFFFFLIQFILKDSDDIYDDYENAIYEHQNKINLRINSSKINNNKINESTNNKKINIAFIYSSLSGNGIARFMVVTADCLLKTGKYNVFFFTKPKTNKELYYNENIIRIYAYNNFTLIPKICKKEKIDILIINNAFSDKMIKWYKSLGVKTIGIYHGVYMSQMFNNSTESYRNWKNLNLYDAFIHISADDYYYYKNLGFTKNIFIPNLYTFEPSLAPTSNLTNHNIMMLGRLNDKKKGLIYAIKAMYLIVKEIPDARLNLVSSDGKTQQLVNTLEELNLTNNVFYTPFTRNISELFLNSSVYFFPSLTEAFPMALNEAKAHGLPCVTFDVSYSLPFQKGVIKVDTFDYKGLAAEAVKLLKNYEYRKKMGKEAKISLNQFSNEKTTNLWERLFKALLDGKDEFQKLRGEIEDKFYNEEIAKKHMEKQFEYLKKYNKYFRCHTLQNFIDINYINNIEVCKNVVR